MNHSTDNWNPLNIYNQTGIIAYEWCISDDCIYWSDNALSVLQIPDIELISTGRAYTSLISIEAATSRAEMSLELAASDNGNGVAFEIEYPLTSMSGTDEELVWVEDVGRVFADSHGAPERVIGTMRIINERHAREAALVQKSHCDSITGLLNSERLDELLDSDLLRVERENGHGAFCIIGISHLEIINDMYGFETGDEIMREIAQRIKNSMRINDTIGRYAGTKLGLVLRDCTDQELLVAGERFLSALRDEVIMTSAGPVSLTVNIGGVIYPNNLSGKRNIMGAAEKALTEAKRSPVPCVHIYEQEHNVAFRRQSNAFTANEVVNAMQAQRMRLAFQPIVSAKTHKVAFHEALIRMIDSDGEIIEAGAFVGVAASLGLIRMVDFCAMKLAIETLTTHDDAVLSLNVTNETAVDPEWLSTLATAVSQNPDIAGRLIVEITESHAAENREESIQFVRTIQDLGCRVAIDDFGAGYTSFANLKHLPVDIIKIDGMYVDDLVNSVENQVFIKSLLDLAKAFSIEVVVEWVSDDETAELLKQWDVDYLQGSSFGSPLIASPWEKI